MSDTVDAPGGVEEGYVSSSDSHGPSIEKLFIPEDVRDVHGNQDAENRHEDVKKIRLENQKFVAHQVREVQLLSSLGDSWVLLADQPPKV